MSTMDACEHDLIPVAPLAEAVLRLAKERTWSALCEDLGWRKSNGMPDTSRLRRRLGFIPYSNGCRDVKCSTHITYGKACEIAQGLGLDPVDIDL